MAKPGRTVKLIAGCMIAAGAGVLLYTGYRVWDPSAGARQRAAQTDLTRSWGGAPTLPAPARATAQPASVACVAAGKQIPVGQVFAIIQIPAFGPDWKFTIIQGTSLAQLATGPGHILGTALPGQAGDVGIGAHDVTAGNPFLHLDSLRTGDTIVITTKECVTTYRVYRQPFRVLYTDVSVLRPVGSTHTLTLVTCWPTGALSFVNYRTTVQAAEASSVSRR